MKQLQPIRIETTIHLSVTKVWECYTSPAHVMKWNQASPDWHTTAAASELAAGGRFDYRMEAKDGSEGFNMTGKYDEVTPYKLIRYTMDDGRQVEVAFTAQQENQTHIQVTFDPESENPLELQQAGWQAILDNFAMYAEEQV